MRPYEARQERLLAAVRMSVGFLWCRAYRAPWVARFGSESSQSPSLIGGGPLSEQTCKEHGRGSVCRQILACLAAS
jgi:hypothetical protein